ncbi:MAG: endonuclease MutS2 [Chloroflexi bacterium]|nr:endonuclease MutS2 [Chloroflexota bacterium]
MNAKAQHLLEFDKVRQRLAGYTSFSGGEDLARTLQPTIFMSEAQRWQAETREAFHLLATGSDVTIGGTRDVRPAVGRALRGYTLLPEDFIQTKQTLIAARELQRKIEKVAERYPILAGLAELIEECPGLVVAIGQTLDDRGEVLDSASTKLANVRRELRIAYGRIHEKLRQLLNSEQSAHLQEGIITLRNGRYVVPVRAESRGQIKGIVHDQSGSGATYWVEPLNTVDLNNEYRNLQMEEQKEIQRILAELSNKVAEQGDEVVRIVERMAEFDLIFARAKYASALRAIEPQFVEWEKRPNFPLHPGCTIWVRGARHPLLDPQTVVPTDLTVPEDIYMVLLTGPNTGGKTVSLKTAGLMVLMAQAGLHLPAKEARLTIFNNVFADIGDEQSIEQSLSTFSAHMTNIIHIAEEVDDRSLVLLDELGSGTDPAEGAALAQAIIDYLRDKGATSFVATHYPELKAYATRTPGATNASLLFDLDTLSPTYEMTIGLPGKSNALAIARRLGLDESILDGALKLVGMGNSETDSLLDSIYDMRDRISSEEAAVRLNRKRAERERQKLEERLAEIEIERERIIAQTRVQMEGEIEALRQELMQVRRGLRQASSQNTLKQLGKNVQTIAEKPREGLNLEPLITAADPHPARQRTLRVGDTVLVKTINTKGEITRIREDEIEVAIGRLHLRAKLDELEFRSRPVAEEVVAESITTKTSGATVGLDLDIRGKRVEEGLAELDRYLDTAVLGRMPWVRIIHGKGTGKLRDAVRRALDQHSGVTTWEEGQDGEGGAGVTVAKFGE